MGGDRTASPLRHVGPLYRQILRSRRGAGNLRSSPFSNYSAPLNRIIEAFHVQGIRGPALRRHTSASPHKPPGTYLGLPEGAIQSPKDRSERDRPFLAVVLGEKGNSLTIICSGPCIIQGHRARAGLLSTALRFLRCTCTSKDLPLTDLQCYNLLNQPT